MQMDPHPYWVEGSENQIWPWLAKDSENTTPEETRKEKGTGGRKEGKGQAQRGGFSTMRRKDS